MKIREIGTDADTLEACAALLGAAFPHAEHLDSRYLDWLYRDNPAGQVVGFNAWENGQLIAHYAAIPVDLMLDGLPARGLLALNTAVHPDFQGVGTIYSLANRTCKVAAERGFQCIYAVANTASTPLLVKSLKFQQVAQLTASLGPGHLRVDWDRALCGNRFRRAWSKEAIDWRISNPSAATGVERRADGRLRFSARTPLPLISAIGELAPPVPSMQSSAAGLPLRLKLYLGLMPEGSVSLFGHIAIPERLKPSPLNFVYRPLGQAAPARLERNEIALGVQDFDAY